MTPECVLTIAMGEIWGEPTGTSNCRRSSRRVWYDALGNHCRRTVLTILEERAEPIREPTLAAAVWAHEHGAPPETVTDADRDRVQAELHHVHLPKLEAAGLISRSDGAVESCLDEHPGVSSAIDRLVETRRPGSARYLTLIAADERRAVVAVLAARDRPMGLTELTTAIAESAGTSDLDVADPELLRLVLHHLHLPRLDQAELVRYDPETQRVSLLAGDPRIDDLLSSCADLA